MRSLLLSSIAVGAMAFAGLAFAQSAETVPTENLQKLGGMQATGTPMSAFQPVPQNDEVRGPAAQEPGAGASRCWHTRSTSMPWCPCARHRGRAAGRRHLRRHPQGRDVGDHRPQQGRRGGRSEALRPVARLRHPERAVLFQGRLPLYRRAQPHPGVPRRRVLL